MKKILALMVCVLMLFSLAACTDDNGNADENNGGIIDDEIDDAIDDVDEGAADEGAVDENDDTSGNNAIGDNESQTLVGTAQGYGGEVKVTVEVNGDDIVSVSATGEKETQGVGSKAIDELPAKIEEADSTDVDGISGATLTSDAIKEAVDKALEGIK